MSIDDMLSIVAGIIVSLGGGAAIVFGFSSWLGKVWANRLMEVEKAKHVKELERLRNEFVQDTEHYKIKLKKSEFIFQKEFKAASEFNTLIRNILPNYKHPDMDWSDVYDFIAINFGKTENVLNEYLKDHGVVLPSKITELISSSSGIAGEGKFDEYRDDVSSQKSDDVERLYKNLKEAEELFSKLIRDQVIT